MRKSRAISTVLFSLTAGSACGQSSVTVFGTMDVNLRVVKADGQRRQVTESSSGINSAQFGVKGNEDLGGGLYAGFLILSDLAPDTGVAGDAVRNKFWNRQSFLQIGGKKWGELRLGRDYTPTFTAMATFDAFNALGLGNMNNIRQLYSGSRVDNSVGYLLPASLGGVYGEVKLAAAENGTTFDRAGRLIGGRLGYANGPMDVQVAYGNNRFAINYTPPSLTANYNSILGFAGDTQTTLVLLGSYNFGAAKLQAYYDREKLRTYKENYFEISGIVPIGLGEVHVGFDHSKLSNTGTPSSTITNMKLQYVYSLSKRTALYGTAARMDNKDATRATLPTAAGPAIPGGKSQGVEFGIRHFF